MLDEGIAREIINRVQKLRKKASLVPTDAVSLSPTLPTLSPSTLPTPSSVGSVEGGGYRVPVG